MQPPQRAGPTNPATRYHQSTPRYVPSALEVQPGSAYTYASYVERIPPAASNGKDGGTPEILIITSLTIL